MIVNKNEFEKAKMRDIITIECDYCSKHINRKKRNCLKNYNYCDNKCQQQHKRNLAKKEIIKRKFKECSICKEEKKLIDFNKNKSKLDGLNTICRVCSNAKSKKYYNLNSDKHKENVKKRNARIIKEQRIKLHEYIKHNDGCVDCGNDDPIVLDFDHRDGVEKVNNISNMIGYYKWERIEEELKKCDIRCANCHRIRTAKQFGWYSNLKKCN